VAAQKASVTYRPLLGGENDGIYSGYDQGRVLHAEQPDF